MNESFFTNWKFMKMRDELIFFLVVNSPFVLFDINSQITRAKENLEIFAFGNKIFETTENIRIFCFVSFKLQARMHRILYAWLCVGRTSMIRCYKKFL